MPGRSALIPREVEAEGGGFSVESDSKSPRISKRRMNGPPSLWSEVMQQLQSELSEFALEAWIRPLVICEDGERRDLPREGYLHG